VASNRNSCLAAIVACAISSPVGAEPLTVKTSGDLAFSAVELDAALALRVSFAGNRSGRSIEATVSSDAGTIHIAVLGRERSLSLDGQRGVDAARLVAFAILELAGDQLDPAVLPPAMLPAVVPPAPPRAAREPEDGVVVETAAIDHAPRASIAVWGIGGSRTESALELGVALAGDARAIVVGGASMRDTTGAAPAAISTRSFPIRVGLAWRGPTLWLGQLELRATAIALLEHASAVVTRTDAIYGGGAAVAWAVPLYDYDSHRGATMLVGAGVDGFATALDYRVDTMPVATTAHVTWWGGLAIAAELWR